MCRQWAPQLKRRDVRWPATGLKVDLSNNSITDSGLEAFLAFLCQQGAQPEELLLIGNPLHEPMALVDLLRHQHAGLSGRLRRLDVASCQLTCECLWACLGVCTRRRPRPALRFGLLNGDLGDLRVVVVTAEKHGLKVDWRGLGPGEDSAPAHEPPDVDVQLVLASAPVAPRRQLSAFQ
mmetsp:Transcript_36247/g.115332  ORF Transcript_36247/g.115332 Transcript_36247/m.115332 type:complete len:179 (-) Transcript_36247:154-690(-)